jgi:hypothetical protein
MFHILLRLILSGFDKYFLNSSLILQRLLSCISVVVKVQGKAIPVTGHGGPLGCETPKAPTFFRAVGSQMAVRLSALRTGHPLPPGRSLVLISVRGWADPRAIVPLEGLDQLKNPMASSRIEPPTFRLVLECLNQFRYRPVVSPGN